MACARRCARASSRRRLLIEYVLIADVNDHVYDAERLAAFVQPLHDACHHKARHSKRTGVLVNLIPFNPGQQHDESGELPQHQREAFDATVDTASQALPTPDARCRRCLPGDAACARRMDLGHGWMASLPSCHLQPPCPTTILPAPTLLLAPPDPGAGSPRRRHRSRLRSAHHGPLATACQDRPQVFIGKEALSEVALREAGRSEAGRSEAQPKQLSEVVRGQTERLLESAGSAMAYRCVACEGTGQRLSPPAGESARRAGGATDTPVQMLRRGRPHGDISTIVVIAVFRRPTTPSSALEEFEDWARTAGCHALERCNHRWRPRRSRTCPLSPAGVLSPLYLPRTPLCLCLTMIVRLSLFISGAFLLGFLSEMRIL